MPNPMTALTRDLMHVIGLDQEPFGIYYSDTKPENAYGPKEGVPISRELEATHCIDWAAVGKNFSCFIGNIWLARRKHSAAFISAREYGCAGGGFFTGMYAPYLNRIPYFVSTGIPGTPMIGERYMPSPESMHAFMQELDPRPAPAEYCIAKPLSSFTNGEPPEFVVFFARPEALTGLYTLVTYTTGNVHAVVSPFGPGCGNITAWPLYYQRKGEERAVLGGFDPSARKFMMTDELTLTVPLGLYEKMLEAAPDSVLRTHTWEVVRKKVERSRRAWTSV